MKIKKSEEEKLMLNSKLKEYSDKISNIWIILIILFKNEFIKF